MNTNSNSAVYVQLWRDLDEMAYDVIEVAHNEYATDADIFQNFRKIAELCEISPRQAITILLMKHLIAIQKGVSLRESMQGRYIDVMNYLRLLYAWDAENGDA